MIRALAAFTAFASLIAAPLGAQSVGSHIKRGSDARTDLHRNDPNAAEKAAHFFARCTAEMRSPLAKKVLELPYLEKDQKKLTKSKVSGGEKCMNRLGYKLRMDYPPLIGGMAEYYVTDIFNDNMIELMSTFVRTGQSDISPAPRNSSEFFSQCVARKDPRGVKDFISTEPTSEAEKDALESVKPLLGQCIPAGEKIALDKISLRAMLSFGLYRELASVASMKTKPAIANAGNQ